MYRFTLFWGRALDSLLWYCVRSSGFQHESNFLVSLETYSMYNITSPKRGWDITIYHINLRGSLWLDNSHDSPQGWPEIFLELGNFHFTHGPHLFLDITKGVTNLIFIWLHPIGFSPWNGKICSKYLPCQPPCWSDPFHRSPQQWVGG